MAPEAAARPLRAGVRVSHVVRTPLTLDRAAALAARSLDDAMHALGISNCALARVWIPKIRAITTDAERTAPLAFVVQDGMTGADVAPVLNEVQVLFVGGTVAWKWATAARWVDLAHMRGLRCHIGRVGTPRLVKSALALGADSIDSAFPLWSTEHLDEFVAALEGREPVRQLALSGVA